MTNIGRDALPCVMLLYSAERRAGVGCKDKRKPRESRVDSRGFPYGVVVRCGLLLEELEGRELVDDGGLDHLLGLLSRAHLE